jgi:hypothetical protein
VDLVDDENFVPVAGRRDVYVLENYLANLSTCVFDAASNSRTSIERLSEISIHEGHAVGSSVRHGFRFGLSVLWQLSAFASNRAVVVFPTPRAPEKR